jgi:pimeloyl-ACP methyl ester carboxylesterase
MCTPSTRTSLEAMRWQTPGMRAGLRVQEGGSGEPLLLLLHGLGATSDVWDRWRHLLARRWPGQWLAPDLPGHGGSRPLSGYTFDTLAAAVAPIVDPDAHTVVLGHSLGGVVGLALASARFGVSVRAVIGLGIKVVWSDEELDRVRALAQRPPTWFASRDEAAARYLRLSGLTGLLPADDPAVNAGLREQDGRWRVAMDPGAFAVGAPDMVQLLARSQAAVTLARGEYDLMNTDEQLAGLGAAAVTVPGVGHNAHVESPELSSPSSSHTGDPAPRPPTDMSAFAATTGRCAAVVGGWREPPGGVGPASGLPIRYAYLRYVQLALSGGRSSLNGPRGAGCSTRASTRLAMNRAVRTTLPPRVTSDTVTTLRTIDTSTRRPARVALTS